MSATRTRRGRGPAVVSWAGIRGAVSLAAALALPTTDAGEPFPDRDLIIFVAFCVIVATLVGQGLPLPGADRLLRLPEDDGARPARRRRRAFMAPRPRSPGSRSSPTRTGCDPRTRLSGCAGRWASASSRFAARFTPEDDGGIEEQSLAYQRLRRELLDAERSAVVTLRREGRINDDVMHRVTRDLDLEDARLDL